MDYKYKAKQCRKDTSKEREPEQGQNHKYKETVWKTPSSLCEVLSWENILHLFYWVPVLDLSGARLYPRRSSCNVAILSKRYSTSTE